jgi:tRNA G18 (ribose-2'-O)-methylase SpoU
VRKPREPRYGLLKRARIWLRAQNTRRRFAKAFAAGAATARPGPYPVVIVADNLRPWRNAGAILRSADAFGARAMYVVGTRFFDPTAAMGALRHVPLRFFRDFREAHAALVADGYLLFALVPPADGSANRYLHDVELPEKTAFVVGNETTGLSFAPDDFSSVERLSVAQYGQMSSLNASVAAALALYEYAVRHSAATGPRAARRASER